MVNVSRENRRYGRVIIEKGLRVSMRSIGSEASYNMETRNVSDTGFFLRFEKPGRFPFTPSSIMEVWLTLEEGSTIFFNGKMTRVVHPEEAISLETEPGIAIKIIQIEKDEENILREFIRKKAMENEGKAKTSSSSQQTEAKQEAESVAETAEASQQKASSKKVSSKKTSGKKASSKKASSKKASSKKASGKKASSKKASSAGQDLPMVDTPPEQVAMPTLPPPVQEDVLELDDDVPELDDLLLNEDKAG